MIEVKNVSYTYMSGGPFETAALKNVSLSLTDGEFIGLMGHTGSGKSTLVQIIGGLEKPTEGSVVIDGQTLHSKECDMRAMRFKIGLVMQYPEYQLFEETVFRDIAFGPTNMGLSEQEIRDRVELAADLAGVKRELLEKSPFELSGGQKRRAAIAGILAMQPKILILDEPTAGLDPAGREELLHKIRDLHKRLGITVLFVSHSMEDIDRQINTEEVQEKAESRALLLPSEVRRLKLIRQCRSLTALINDEAATKPEKKRALAIIEKYKRELYNNSMLIKIDRQIDHMEEQKRRLKVQELSFNSYYEFALERIPQITQLEKISFNIHDFAAILKQFYRGGELEMTLNSDLDINLFDERFIVFEIDKIKDDPVLFPIVVLIIMDVFLQKMRIKKGRKALIIEEAWKAIASPTMAEYIKYLYKTVRKFHGIAGVVTQELNDVIDSPIVKEAIINNSDVKILLDQTKFKDRYEDIAAILGLTDIQRQQIFTINALNNHEGRSYFKEVWICRGQHSDVYGVEEAPECYWAYTTERTEKEALKIYLARYGTLQEAITRIEEDRKADGGLLYLEFARKVNQHQKVMSLW